jgi:hypothetical protein
LLLQVAHAFLYTWMDFFQSSNVWSRCYLTFFHERSIALVRAFGWFTKRTEWSQPAYANKVLLKVAHFLSWMGLLSIPANWRDVCNLAFFHIPTRVQCT